MLIYAMNYAPELAGAGRYTGEIGAAIEATGSTLEVVTAPPHYPGWYVRDGYRRWGYTAERSPGRRIYRCPLLLRRKMGGIWRLLAPVSFAAFSFPVLAWRILRFRPDTVFCVEPTLFCAMPAALLARLVGARTVLHVQDLELDAAFEVGHLSKLAFLRGIATAYERATRRLFDRVVTISLAMRSALIRKGVAPEKVEIVRNWVDQSRIAPMSGPNPFRGELGLDAGCLVVEYAGNIGTKQALDLVLEAASRLVDVPDLVFVIAGDGPAKADLVARYGQLPNVRFLDLQPEEKLCALLNLADLHVLPQMREAADLVLPSKLGGMLASGRPILVTAAEGTELSAFLQGAAILVPPGDADALAEAICAFARDRADPGAARRAELAGELSSTKQLPRLIEAIQG
ncbi:WcaI family glycosyltransferase [Sphingomonas sp. HITSZ_GF]|uniref:WcaI family glycosyltransferase n=1 Tax=Sphingomonas sp. HITSZ_GF TaxID=3037247 RepID=UPI00240D4CA6|nr:WcaI family glycosyltransferase [Sphingomonas sp. HITSZ_GF]MDG2535784.1 WcaI family glycosyltransferase [Sphingomonas sp. HITSZ_GF]